MPSVGLGRSLVHYPKMEYVDQGCQCCPYGYHIDLDFVPFTKKMLSREGDVERLQELKEKWRSERQSMDKLLGVQNIAPKIWDVNATISRASTDIWKSGRDLWELDLITRRTRADSSEGSNQEGVQDTGKGLTVSSNGGSGGGIVFENGLSEAVTDFEEALLRTRPQARILSYEIPDTQKFHTFPRIKAPGLRDPVTGSSTLAASNLFSLKGSTSSNTSTLSTVIMKDLTKASSKESNKRSEDSLSVEMESIYSRTARQRDDNRNSNLEERLQELEEQVKRIPELEVKLTLVKEEKRQLMKLLEVEKDKLSQQRFIGGGDVLTKPTDRGIVNGKKNGAPAVPPRRKTRDASVGNKAVLTRDVGVSHVMPRTRSVGVGGMSDISTWERNLLRGDSCSPTESSSGTLKRRVKTFEAGVQVNDYDLTDSKVSNNPVLQIVERIECGVQTTGSFREPSVERNVSIKKHAGTTVKPTTTDVGVSNKPSQRDAGVSAILVDDNLKDSKVKVKHVGVGVSLELQQPVKEVLKPKMSRAVAINTDKLRTNSVGCNTTEVKKAALDASVTSVSPRTAETEVVERTTDPLKSSMSLPLFASSPSSPRQPSAEPNLSPIETKGQSKIPRLAAPISSPVVSPKPTARSLPTTPRERDNLESSSSSFSNYLTSTSSIPSPIKKPSFQRSDTYTKDMYLPERSGIGTLEPLEEEDREGPKSSASSSSGFVPVQEDREKAVPSKEMQAALKVLNDALLRGKTTQQVTNAISIILHEWFRIAGTKTANPLDVEDYLDSFEIYSPQLLRYIVNMPDGNGNTALHYAVSHGNFDVVSILLDSKVCDPNKANKAGYTSIMLVALAKITCEAHRQVVRRLFSLGDVNIKAALHGQTALMLGASHGRFDTIRLLLEAGADINIQDEDGSTALMCAAEHGHLKIIKYLVAHPDCDLTITDTDGSTAFTIAMEGGFKDIGVLLYAQMHFVPAKPPSPGSSSLLQYRSRSTTPSSHNSASSSVQTSPLLASKKKRSEMDLFLTK